MKPQPRQIFAISQEKPSIRLHPPPPRDSHAPSTRSKAVRSAPSVAGISGELLRPRRRYQDLQRSDLTHREPTAADGLTSIVLNSAKNVASSTSSGLRVQPGMSKAQLTTACFRWRWHAGGGQPGERAAAHRPGCSREWPRLAKASTPPPAALFIGRASPMPVCSRCGSLCRRLMPSRARRLGLIVIDYCS